MRVRESVRVASALRTSLVVLVVLVLHGSGAAAEQRRFEKKNCIDCHKTFTEKLQPLKSLHPGVKDNDCESCHNTTSFANATFDHSRVTGNCMSCHNGTTATGKGAGHFVTSLDCNACHNTTRWSPTLAYRHASPNYPDHGTRLECRACHSTNTQVATWPFAAFKPDDHSLVERDYQPCFACHKPMHEADYLFSLDALTKAARN